MNELNEKFIKEYRNRSHIMAQIANDKAKQFYCALAVICAALAFHFDGWGIAVFVSYSLLFSYGAINRKF